MDKKDQDQDATKDSPAPTALLGEPTLRMGNVRPMIQRRIPTQARQVDLPRVVHLLRRAALTLQTQDPVAPVLKEIVAELLRSGASVDHGQRKLTTIAAALALDPHAEAATRDVRAALELL